MESHIKLILNNKVWAQEKLEDDPDYFINLAREQKPEFLWIGCSDSRVPANEVIGAEPGELFVHRNIANMVVPTDMNLLSVLQYAVEELKVSHIIVCGHYGCGGVKAAMANQHLGMLNNWLQNIKDVYKSHEAEIKAFASEDERLHRMVELNVVQQVYNLAKTSIIQMAWQNRQAPLIHGWVYGLDNGIIRRIVEMNHETPVGDIYRYNLK